MESRSLPGGGYQHTVAVSLAARPPVAFEDSVIALANLEVGWSFPMVEVLGETPKGYRVLVSVFGQSPEPSPQELGSLQGTVAELLWHDRQASVL